VFAVQSRSKSCESFNVILRVLSDNGEEVDIRSLATDPVVLGDHKAAQAAQLDGSPQKLVKLSQE
jgi:hypothetical protein